jgi:transcriptional regulator with XRE-family HTH domain
MTDRRSLKGFPKRFREMREGFTQVETAQILGITQQQVSRYESNVDWPSVTGLVEISIQFGVSVDWLLFGVE